MKKVLEALREVLKYKKWTTFVELASLVKYDKLRVIRILNDNEQYIRKDKTGKIVGFSDWKSKETDKVFKAGNIYIASLINYGAATELMTANVKANDLRETYYCGGFGDSYAVSVILDKPENRAKLKELKIIPMEEYKFVTLDQLWKE